MTNMQAINAIIHEANKLGISYGQYVAGEWNGKEYVERSALKETRQRRAWSNMNRIAQLWNRGKTDYEIALAMGLNCATAKSKRQLLNVPANKDNLKAEPTPVDVEVVWDPKTDRGWRVVQRKRGESDG